MSNWGKEAYQRGEEHARNIFKLHGLKVIKKLARYKPQNDYERGKIETAKQICAPREKALQLSAEELKNLIRLGHPNQHGSEFTRFDIMWAIRKRGFPLLKELGWSMKPDSTYINLHTLKVSSYRSIIMWLCYDGWSQNLNPHHKPLDNLFSLLEHWEPKESYDYKQFKKKLIIDEPPLDVFVT